MGLGVLGCGLHSNSRRRGSWAPFLEREEREREKRARRTREEKRERRKEKKKKIKKVKAEHDITQIVYMQDIWDTVFVQNKS